MTEVEYEDPVDVNVRGVLFGAQAAAERMVESGGGSIINVSSLEGVRGVDDHPADNAARSTSNVW